MYSSECIRKVNCTQILTDVNIDQGFYNLWCNDLVYCLERMDRMHSQSYGEMLSKVILIVETINPQLGSMISWAQPKRPHTGVVERKLPDTATF